MNSNRERTLRKQEAGARHAFEGEHENHLQAIKGSGAVLPLCARCKMVRNSSGSWQDPMEYFRTHHKATYTHTICPRCAKLLYPELVKARH